MGFKAGFGITAPVLVIAAVVGYVWYKKGR